MHMKIGEILQFKVDVNELIEDCISELEVDPTVNGDKFKVLYQTITAFRRTSIIYNLKEDSDNNSGEISGLISEDSDDVSDYSRIMKNRIYFNPNNQTNGTELGSTHPNEKALREKIFGYNTSDYNFGYDSDDLKDEGDDTNYVCQNDYSVDPSYYTESSYYSSAFDNEDDVNEDDVNEDDVNEYDVNEDDVNDVNEDDVNEGDVNEDDADAETDANNDDDSDESEDIPANSYIENSIKKTLPTILNSELEIIEDDILIDYSEPTLVN